MKSLQLDKNLLTAFAIVKAPNRRGFVRVTRVAVMQIYEPMHGAAVQEITRRIPHFLPFSRLSQIARRAELPGKLRRAIAEEQAAHERQTEMFRLSGLPSKDLPAPDEKSAVDKMLAGDGADLTLSK